MVTVFIETFTKCFFIPFALAIMFIVVTHIDETKSTFRTAGNDR